MGPSLCLLEKTVTSKIFARVCVSVPKTDCLCLCSERIETHPSPERRKWIHFRPHQCVVQCDRWLPIFKEEHRPLCEANETDISKMLTMDCSRTLAMNVQLSRPVFGSMKAKKMNGRAMAADQPVSWVQWSRRSGHQSDWEGWILWRSQAPPSPSVTPPQFGSLALHAPPSGSRSVGCRAWPRGI